MRTFCCCFVVYTILCFVKPLYGEVQGSIKAQDSGLAVHRRDDDGGKANKVNQVSLDDNQRSPKLTDQDSPLNQQSGAEEINRFVYGFHPKTEILAPASMQLN